MNMDFGTNEIPVKIIKEGAFGGTCLGDIYSGVHDKWYKKSWKEFDEIIKCWSELLLLKLLWCHGVKCGTSLRFWENNG